MSRGSRLRFAVVLAGFAAVICLQAPTARAEDSLMASQAGVQFAAVLPHDALGNGISVNSNKAGGVEAAYTFHMDKWMAAGFEYGKTRYTSNFSGSFGSAAVQNNVNQVELDFLLTVPA